MSLSSTTHRSSSWPPFRPKSYHGGIMIMIIIIIIYRSWLWALRNSCRFYNIAVCYWKRCWVRLGIVKTTAVSTKWSAIVGESAMPRRAAFHYSFLMPHFHEGNLIFILAVQGCEGQGFLGQGRQEMTLSVRVNKSIRVMLLSRCQHRSRSYCPCVQQVLPTIRRSF